MLCGIGVLGVPFEQELNVDIRRFSYGEHTMTDAGMRQVILPGGKKVKISDTPQSWWNTEGGSGYIDPRLLAPDPDQPRKHMQSAEFNELKRSIGERGVRQPLIVTPRAKVPWVALPTKHNSLPFVIVGGHRRQRGSLEEGVQAVPIHVMIYPNEEDHRLDAWILNKDHEDLSPLEEGWEIVRLNKQGVSFEKIAAADGSSLPYVLGRRDLTKLCPGIQQLIDPKLPAKEQLALTVASELGAVPSPTQQELETLHRLLDEEVRAVQNGLPKPARNLNELGPELLRFELQKVLLAGIQFRKLAAARAIDFILEHTGKLTARQSNVKKSDRSEPRKRKAILQGVPVGVLQSRAVDWTQADYEEMLANSSAREIELMIEGFSRAAAKLIDIRNNLRSCLEKKQAGPVCRAATAAG